MIEDSAQIRFAKPEDAAALVEIYKPYVLETAISFEYEAPSIDEFAERIRSTQKKYPYFVAEQGKEIVGYSYAGVFVNRAAYNWSAETTVYIKQGNHRQGIGRRLYKTLENALNEMNVINLFARIGYTEIEDEYLTKNSVKFHKRLGFSIVGQYAKCGYKFNRWYDIVEMEKIIGDHPSPPEAVIKVNDIRGNLRDKYHIE